MSIMTQLAQRTRDECLHSLCKNEKMAYEPPPCFDTRVLREFDYFLAPLNFTALFGKSAKSIAQGTQNFLDKKDLIQSTNFPFSTFHCREKKSEKVFDV
jgi:hypothetical protein